LNEPKAAAVTCTQALKMLNATPRLGKNPLVQAIAQQVAEQLSQNPAAHVSDSQD
jgi:hypothetical protein